MASVGRREWLQHQRSHDCSASCSPDVKQLRKSAVAHFRRSRVKATSAAAGRAGGLTPVAPLLAEQMSADYIPPLPTIDLTDDELAAVTAAIRRTIETDRFPRSPRLDPLRSAPAKLESATARSQPRTQRPRRQPKSTSALGDVAASDGGQDNRGNDWTSSTWNGLDTTTVRRRP